MSAPTHMTTSGVTSGPRKGPDALPEAPKDGYVASIFVAHRRGFLAGGTLLGVIAGLLLRTFGASAWLAAGASLACFCGCFALAYIRPDPATLVLTDVQRRQRARSIAIGLALGALVALFYVATIVRLGSNVANRAL